MDRKKPLTRKQKGFVLLTGGLMLMFVIPVVGLAIDAGFLYAVKAKLQSGTDAAALAAARSLAVGLTIADQEASARSRAEAFFLANYPPGMFNTTSRSLTVEVAETGFRTRTVTVTAAVDSPLFFMRMLVNAPTTIVNAVGKASRRDVNVILVLDRSGSMNSNGGCPAMRAAANGFVDLFANQRDRMAMVTYGISYALSYAPSMDFKSGNPTLSGVINTIACEGGTGSAQGLFQGYQQIATINEPGALNVIVFFTDGIPNTVTANYPVNVLDTTRVADHRSLSFANKTSRCYDFQNGRRWFATGSPGVQQGTWMNGNTQVYRGAIYAQEGIGGDSAIGVYGATTANFTDAGLISYPHASTSDVDPSDYTTPSNRTNDCWFRGGNGHDGGGEGTNNNHVQYDMAYYPDNDLYGTPLRSADNFVTVNNFPAGNPYAGRIDIRDRTNMMNASIAAVDNVGKRIRNNDLGASLNTVVYTIGLGDAGANQHTLLKRIANDATSPIYDGTKLEGLYVFAPTAADMNAAFVRIASEILRYAQ